jgi:hypothetical protein
MAEAFRPLSQITARWRHLEGGPGLVQTDLRAEGNRIVIDGMTIGERDGLYAAKYRIVCRDDWTTLSLDVETTDGRAVRVTADGNGRWKEAGGKALPQFDGCIDVDLEGTPFTNTLPVRRLGLSPEQGAIELRMFYVPFTTFEPFVDDQRYRCVRPRHYRYEAVDGSFSADITVDEDGLVSAYPPLFERLEP